MLCNKLWATIAALALLQFASGGIIPDCGDSWYHCTMECPTFDECPEGWWKVEGVVNGRNCYCYRYYNEDEKKTIEEHKCNSYFDQCLLGIEYQFSCILALKTCSNLVVLYDMEKKCSNLKNQERTMPSICTPAVKLFYYELVDKPIKFLEDTPQELAKKIGETYQLLEEMKKLDAGACNTAYMAFNSSLEVVKRTLDPKGISCQEALKNLRNTPNRLVQIILYPTAVRSCTKQLQEFACSLTLTEGRICKALEHTISQLLASQTELQTIAEMLAPNSELSIALGNFMDGNMRACAVVGDQLGSLMYSLSKIEIEIGNRQISPFSWLSYNNEATDSE